MRPESGFKKADRHVLIETRSNILTLMVEVNSSMG